MGVPCPLMEWVCPSGRVMIDSPEYSNVSRGLIAFSPSTSNSIVGA